MDDRNRIVRSLDELAGERFACIYAETYAETDPDFRGLPVAELAADHAMLFVWTANAHADRCGGIVAAWGFEDTGDRIVWGRQQQSLLIGTRGGVKLADFWTDSDRKTKAGRSRVIFAPPIGGTRKPDCFRGLVERIAPGPRLELFGRRPVPGWTVHGHQVERGLFTV